MKFNLILSALLVSASLSFAADEPKKPAEGAKPKPNPEEAFKKMDKNADGKLSKEEFLGKREGEAKTKGETQFTAKDKDKDGSLSKEEFMAAPGKKKKDK
jgi:hypothetical protein